ncbi:hypothetical protein ASPTUDRAFT_77455 [Aspergillus tubingensis CBS 134.48]|uniref:Uncharacterized protein n=1 Tax=Aspergillus tubingensis (strain CBS 134.48) TaxID=767770 RepID=A0A1L9MZ26_ASPTC|nr:hypothetical protein ASPTUDRAFT_77455 [Aspergillus tubingensis CBS 134.48]
MATVGAETAMTAHARYRWFKTRHHSFSGSGETRQIGNKRAMGSQRDRRIITRKGLFITIHAKLPRMRAEGKRGLFRPDGINSSDV